VLVVWIVMMVDSVIDSCRLKNWNCNARVGDSSQWEWVCHGDEMC
jgi:hypothetical protein